MFYLFLCPDLLFRPDQDSPFFFLARHHPAPNVVCYLIDPRWPIHGIRMDGQGPRGWAQAAHHYHCAGRLDERNSLILISCRGGLLLFGWATWCPTLTQRPLAICDKQQRDRNGSKRWKNTGSTYFGDAINCVQWFPVGLMARFVCHWIRATRKNSAPLPAIR